MNNLSSAEKAMEKESLVGHPSKNNGYSCGDFVVDCCTFVRCIFAMIGLAVCFAALPAFCAGVVVLFGGAAWIGALVGVAITLPVLLKLAMERR